MTIRDLLAAADAKAVGAAMHAMVVELYPLCRSITGDGLRQTLAGIARRIPLAIHEVPTGTRVFDWTIPKEWNVRAATLKDPRGRVVVDFKDSNLHVVSYSTPVEARLSLAALRPHLHSLPEHPDWVPYRTTYYKEDWGLCLSHRQLEALEDGEYEVRIDATLAPGSLSYGELFLPGASEDEILVSCHVCHPSLANDNLAGVAVVTALAERLATVARRYSYRFVFAPGTIGAIAWLARNEAGLGRIKHGLVAACLGDPGPMTYKRTRAGAATIDRAVLSVLGNSGEAFEVLDFVPFGYDERQFNSPGIALAVGSLTRTPHGRYPEYHTSADNPDLVTPEALADSWSKYLQVFEILEGNETYINLSPKGEPQLGRRGLYRAVGGGGEGREKELALLWVLNLSDGRHSLLDVAERSRLGFAAIRAAADLLLEAELLAPASSAATP